MLKKMLALLAAAAVLAFSVSTAIAEAHEPVTFSAPFRDASNFIEVVHKYYPEINIEVVPYSGQNMTAYIQASLARGFG